MDCVLPVCMVQGDHGALGKAPERATSIVSACTTQVVLCEGFSEEQAIMYTSECKRKVASEQKEALASAGRNESRSDVCEMTNQTETEGMIASWLSKLNTVDGPSMAT